MEPTTFSAMAITVDGSARADADFWAEEQRRLPVAPFSDNSYGYLSAGLPTDPIVGAVQGSIAGTVIGTALARAPRVSASGEGGEIIPTFVEPVAVT